MQWLIGALSAALTVFLLFAFPAFAKNSPHPAPQDVMSWVTFALGLLGSLIGAIAWYKGAIEKQYAAQRSFEHLRRNQEQMSSILVALDKRVDELGRQADGLESLSKDTEHQLDGLKVQMIEAKGLLTALFQQTQVIASKISSDTGGWSRKDLP